MRIIAGTAGRIPIQVPSAVARPTTDFVRQAIFSILGEVVAGARVLDLFAGSGALGLEALSRGAASCLFVEQNKQATAVISRNLAKTSLVGGRVTQSEVASFLKRDAATYDLIFADPPYFKHRGETDHLAILLGENLIVPRMSPGGWFIAETSEHYQPPDSPSLPLIGRRLYGSSAVLLFQAANC
ncbi:MAG: 16S rRNA (guanine(966)-N(2))-methyltransferase RsmD [Verrucomicrobiota bacterium]